MTTISEIEAAHQECICGGRGYFTLKVPVSDQWFGHTFRCVCQRKEDAKRKASKLRSRSGLTDSMMARWQLDNWLPESIKVGKGESRPQAVEKAVRLLRICHRYVNNPKGWFTMSGPFGTGKTHLAYAIGSELLNQGLAVYAGTVPDMLTMFRASYKEDSYEATLHELRDVDVLVLDDLGVQKPSDWVTEALYTVLNYRYNEAMPVVITTNLSFDGKMDRARLDGRLCSRIQEGFIATLDWGDFRIS